MKAFDLDLYNQLVKEGKTPKIVTRGGCDVRILCTDKMDSRYPIVALVKDSEGETARLYCKDGIYYSNKEGNFDLFFADTEPTYRPYKDAEELMKGIIHNCGWVKQKTTGDLYPVIEVRNTRDGRMIIGTYYSDIAPEEMLQDYTWFMTNDPCGVKEE